MPRASWDWESRIGSRVKLRDLHILSSVVRWGSMAKGASHLAMSQSAVSEAIANLESALGVRLLDRSSHGIEPTIYAGALLKRGHAVFDELREGIKDIEFLADPTAGEVRIACPEFLAAGLLPIVIDRLSRQYPKFVVRVTQLNTAIMASTPTLEFRELQERSVDLVLTRIPRTLRDNDLDIEILFDDPFFVVAGAGSRWARHGSIGLAELVNDPWVLPPAPLVGDVLRQAFEAEGLEVPSEMVTASSILLRNQLLTTGRFLSVLAESVLRNNAERWSLKALPIDLRFKPSPIAIGTLRNRTVSPAVQLFIEHLRAVAKSMSGPAEDLRS